MTQEQKIDPRIAAARESEWAARQALMVAERQLQDTTNAVGLEQLTPRGLSVGQCFTALKDAWRIAGPKATYEIGNTFSVNWGGDLRVLCWQLKADGTRHAGRSPRPFSVDEIVANEA